MISRRMLLIGSLAVALIAAATVTLLVTRDDGPEYPEAWDSRVLPYVELVERYRKLDFKHPVYVDFLTEKKFRDEVSRDEELTEEEKAEIEQFTGLFRALGLLRGRVDLAKETEKLSTSGTLAFYSYETKRITMRGETLTPKTKATLVHELTHALQDQHFNLSKKIDEYEDQDNSRATTFDALIEGDADRVEDRYVKGLSKKQKRALDREQARAQRKFSTDTAKIPPVLQTLTSAPYVLGKRFLTILQAHEGLGAIDDALASPPASEESLYDPVAQLRGRGAVKDVEKPALNEGEEEIERGEFGVLAWAMTLASQLDYATTLDAVDGWGGDRYVAYEKSGRSCIRINYVADSDRDRRQMASALRKWSDARGRSARFSTTADHLELDTCDPGTKARLGDENSDTVLSLLAVRMDLADVGIRKQNLAFADCWSRRAVTTLTTSLLGSNFTEADGERLRALTASCFG